MSAWLAFSVGAALMVVSSLMQAKYLKWKAVEKRVPLYNWP